MNVFFARLNGDPVDRIPNLCLIMTFAARQIGVPYGQFVTDYHLLAEGMLHCYEKYDLDVLSVCSDPMREAGGFGADVIIPADGVPYCSKNLLQNLGDIAKLKVIDPSSNERMNDRLEAIRLLKAHIQKDAPVIGWVEGAVAESCDLMGISECLCEMLDEPEAIHELLSILPGTGLFIRHGTVKSRRRYYRCGRCGLFTNWAWALRRICPFLTSRS